MPVGFIAAGAMNNLLSDWHRAFLTGIIPLVTVAIAVFTLPESKSWKLNKKDPADNNHSSGRLFASAYKNNLFIGTLIFGAMRIGLWAVFSCAPT